MQPDTQREGPAYRLGQGTTQDQPRGEGKQKQAGVGADKRQTNKTQAKGPNHTGEHNTKGETPKGTEAEASHRHIANPKGQSPKGNEATKQGRRTEATTRPSRSRPREAESEKGGRKSRNPAKVRKGPHTTIANGSKLYCGAQGRRAR